MREKRNLNDEPTRLWKVAKEGMKPLFHFL
jgi:hypothetical protein